MPEILILSLQLQKFKILNSGLVEFFVVVLTVPYIKTANSAAFFL